MKDETLVSVVLGTYNRLEFLKSTIDTVRSSLPYERAEIIVVDGGSDDGTVKWLIKQKDIITILQHNRGRWRGKPIDRKSWGYFMNLGFRAASGKYICMLSDDCLLVPGALKNGLELMESKRKQDSKIGMAAFYWRNWPEQDKYWVGIGWGERMFVNHGLYLREALEAVDFIDDKSYFFYHADGDLAQKIWAAGYTCVDAPNSHVEHYSDANTEVRASNQSQQSEDWKTYKKKWGHLGAPKRDWLEKSFRDTHRTAEKYWQRSKKKFWRQND